MHSNNNAAEYNQRGMTAYNSKDYEMAKSLFAVAIEKDPDAIDARRNYAEVLLELGDYERGIQTFMEVLGKHGNDILTLFRLSQLYAEIGQNSDAITLLEKIIEIEPGNLDANAMLAKLTPTRTIGNNLNVKNDNIHLDFNKPENLNSNQWKPQEKPQQQIPPQFNNKVLMQNDLNIDISTGISSVEPSVNLDLNTLPSTLTSNNDSVEFLGQLEPKKEELSVETQDSDNNQLSKFSTAKFFKRKFKNRDLVLLKGAVEEDGDSYVIDLDPCVHGWVFHVEKKFVEIKPTHTSVSLPDYDEVQIYYISIKRGAPMIKLEFCVSDDLDSLANQNKKTQKVSINQDLERKSDFIN